jgi:hypothetical protein
MHDDGELQSRQFMTTNRLADPLESTKPFNPRSALHTPAAVSLVADSEQKHSLADNSHVLAIQPPVVLL